jgi:site-specific DNA recombinase
VPRNSSANRGAAVDVQRDDKPRVVRCAIYTRKSTEEGLQQEFNSLDAQRESAEAYIRSQKHEGWQLLPEPYDDGGYTGGNMDRPAIQRLLSDIDHSRVDCVVVYKVDRLSRSLLDFAKMMEIFDKRGVSFVSVTQQFNTTNSLGRLTLNILLSFAQFEREIISERTRDKLSAARRKGKWIGGHPVLGYDIDPKGGRIIVNGEQAQRVRAIFDLYVRHGSISSVWEELARREWKSKQWTTEAGVTRGGKPISKSGLYGILTNALYNGMVDHKGTLYPGQHERIVDQRVWEQVQKTLQENGRTNGAIVKNKYGALLRGLLVCAHCGTAMVHTYTNKGTRRYRYYVCAKAQQKGWKTCKTKSVAAEPVERAVLSSIRQITTDVRLAESVLAEAVDQYTRRKQELQTEQVARKRPVRAVWTK